MSEGLWATWSATSAMHMPPSVNHRSSGQSDPLCLLAFRCLELTDNNPRAAILGWITGWLNVLGQFATTAFAADILASHIASMWVLGNGHVFTNVEMLLAYAGIPNPLLTSHGLDCIMPPLQGLLNLHVLLRFDAAELAGRDGVA